MTNTPNEFSPDLNVAQETLQPFDVREREGLSPLIKLVIHRVSRLIIRPLRSSLTILAEPKRLTKIKLSLK